MSHTHSLPLQEWQDLDHILVGTKCNSLLNLELSTGNIQQISIPSAPLREFSTHTPGWGACGIHAITSNSAKDLLATGGSDPADCQILSLPDFSPVQTLVGHLDWVFGLAWVTDRHIVTGSRDGSTALWNVDASPDRQSVQRKNFLDKNQMKRKYNGKVRDLRYSSELGRLAALSTEGCVKLQDPAQDLRVIRSMPVIDPNTGYNYREVVCMEFEPHLVAVGSLSHVNMLDPRRKDSCLFTIDSPDPLQGVRSVSIHRDYLLSFGTGKGKICFYDIRAQRMLPTDLRHHPHEDCTMNYMDWEASDLNGRLRPAGGQSKPIQKEPKRYLETGSGWLDRNEVYLHHFGGFEIKNACYAHAWDPSGTRLFACGGPLAFGLRGCYMALWH